MRKQDRTQSRGAHKLDLVPRWSTLFNSFELATEFRQAEVGPEIVFFMNF